MPACGETNRLATFCRQGAVFQVSVPSSVLQEARSTTSTSSSSKWRLHSPCRGHGVHVAVVVVAGVAGPADWDPGWMLLRVSERSIS